MRWVESRRTTFLAATTTPSSSNQMSRPSQFSQSGEAASIYAPHPQFRNNQPPQPPPLTGAAARLAAKQKELEGLKVLREHSKKMADDIEKLADQVDMLVQGGDCECTRDPRQSSLEVGEVTV